MEYQSIEVVWWNTRMPSEKQELVSICINPKKSYKKVNDLEIKLMYNWFFNKK